MLKEETFDEHKGTQDGYRILSAFMVVAVNNANSANNANNGNSTPYWMVGIRLSRGKRCSYQR